MGGAGEAGQGRKRGVGVAVGKTSEREHEVYVS